MKQLSQILLTCFIIIYSISLHAGVTERVKFKPGTSWATIEGAVLRGEEDRYLLGAKAGQTMTVSISSIEANAVFTVYKPGEKDPYPGAAEGDEAARWSGGLTVTGDQVIVVSGTRGNANYTLSVSIR